MTEFLPRRPRVLGSPRLVALAKEGVPPELGTRVRSPSTTRVRGARVENPGPADRVVFECRPKRWVFPAGRRAEHRPVPVRPGANRWHSHASISSAPVPVRPGANLLARWGEWGF